MRFKVVLIVLAVGLVLSFSTAQRAQQGVTARPDGRSDLTTTPPAGEDTSAAEGAVVAEERVAIRKGAAAIPERELASRAKAVLSDARYAALKRVADKRRISLDASRLKGLVFPEGNRTVFVPALDRQGRESGFLASDGTSWTLSLITQEEVGSFEAYLAKFAEDGRVIVEAGPTPKRDEDDGVHYQQAAGSAGGPTSCQYVSKYGINFGCWVPNSNPFGYYYVQTYRWGTTPDPRSPSWRACYRGSIHVCPRYDSGTYNLPICGFPPGHPQG